MLPGHVVGQTSLTLTRVVGSTWAADTPASQVRGSVRTTHERGKEMQLNPFAISEAIQNANATSSTTLGRRPTRRVVVHPTDVDAGAT